MENQNIAIFTKEDEVFMAHLWDLNTLSPIFLLCIENVEKKQFQKNTGCLFWVLLKSHDRIEAFTYNTIKQTVTYSVQRDQFPLVVMSTAQIIKCQKLSVNANLSTSLRYQQKAPVEIHMKKKFRAKKLKGRRDWNEKELE